jgi:AcrR family transcriptional regulator
MTSSGRGASSPGRVEKRHAVVAQTREAVLGATLDLLAEVGVGGVTVERIAERSGVARSTIYRRWPDQTRLYLEAFERIVRRPLPSPRGDLELELEQYLDDYASRLNDPTYFSVLIALLEMGWRDEQFARAQREFFDERRSRAAEIVRAGMQAGTVRPDIDVRNAMKAIEAPFLHTRMIDNELITPDEVTRVVADLLERLRPPDVNGGAASAAGQSSPTTRQPSRRRH